MSRLYNVPHEFVDEAVEGFVAANSRWVRRVRGGVVRRSETPLGQVAVVIGGGSGHYPAFAGLVGPGLAHGAAIGNLFASPSAQGVYDVALAVENGGGVLLTYGNYAGDVLNFTQAEERLNSEGVPTRTVVVTDDVASAPADEKQNRRGIAGDLVVFKSAAAAAQEGRSLDEVARVAQRVNERTRSFGVAFSGCTLPGASEPLFTVPEGRMAIGMGVHGEPGVDETDLPTADGLAELLVGRLFDETTTSGIEAGRNRVAVVLNGLGSVKCEELFVVYRRVAQLLDEAGLTPVDPEVGEFVTSFEMAGVSLTLCWLDDELELLWTASASTPAFRRGTFTLAVDDVASVSDESQEVRPSIPPASESSKQGAVIALEALRAAARTVDEHVDWLGQLDAVAGDGDHGIGMQRGIRAAVEAAERMVGAGAGMGTVLQTAGASWAERSGGASGALWGIALRALGECFGDDEPPSMESLANGVAAANQQLMRHGSAAVGDKTMIDVLTPVSETLREKVENGVALGPTLRAVADEAERAARATANLMPRIGRAKLHAKASAGVPDAGATSLSLIIRAAATVGQHGPNGR